MTLTEVERPPYEPPALEVLGELTSLAEGAGPGGTRIVMTTGIPFASNTAPGMTISEAGPAEPTRRSTG